MEQKDERILRNLFPSTPWKICPPSTNAGIWDNISIPSAKAMEQILLMIFCIFLE